jgi:uncharacterized SAM-binding protein YcdF (DUF218 family)
MKLFPRRRWWLLLAVLGLLTGLYLGRAALLPRLASWLDVGRPPKPADVIMLLNGEAETRAMAAAALWKAGWAPRILLTTVADDPQRGRSTVPLEHEINLRVLAACGVPRSAVTLLDGQARSTYDEATVAAGYLEQSSPRRLLALTNGFHTRRARWIFQRVLGSGVEEISMISVPTDDLRVATWWQSERGFATVAGEYLKLGFYILRYSYLGAEVAVVVAAWLVWRGYRRKRLAGKGLGTAVD